MQILGWNNDSLVSQSILDTLARSPSPTPSDSLTPAMPPQLHLNIVADITQVSPPPTPAYPATATAIRSVCMSPSGNRLLVGTQGCEIVEYDLPPGFRGLKKTTDLKSPLAIDQKRVVVSGHFKDELWGLAVRPTIDGSEEDQYFGKVNLFRFPCTPKGSCLALLWSFCTRYVCSLGPRDM